MKSQTQPQTQTTSAGTSINSPETKASAPKSETASTEAAERKPKKAPEDSQNEFENRIARAQLNGEAWVETTPNILQLFNRNGLNGAKYFVYKGVKVCLQGEAEQIEKDEALTIEERTFGKTKGPQGGAA